MDDLLDLEWDKKSAAVGIAQSGATKSAYNSSYNFDALTRSLPQQQQNSTLNRSNNSSSIANSSSVRQAQQQSNTSKQPSSDAFSSLLGFDSNSSSSSSGGGSKLSNNAMNISMAERLKRDHQQRLAKTSESGRSTPTLSASPADSAWEGLDMFLAAPKKSQPVSTSSNGKTATASNSRKVAEENIWDFSNDSSSTKMMSNAKQTQISDNIKQNHPPTRKEAFDFSEFEDPGQSQSSALGESNDVVPQRTKSPSKRSQLLDDSFEEDDVLDSLGKSTPSSLSSQQLTKTRPVKEAIITAPKRPVSPPPHIIGQIVEMGFSPQQARQALAATDSGLDVSIAIEKLLSQTNSAFLEKEEDYDRDREMARGMQREEERYRSDQRRQRPKNLAQEEKREGSNGGLDLPVEWQKQADQIYIQASEIGASVFSKANALWSTAKAQAQRAIEERSGNESGMSSGRSSPATGSDRARNRRWAVPSRDTVGSRKEWQGKPKWMVDVDNRDNAAESQEKPEMIQSSDGFRDDDDDDRIHNVKVVKPFVQKSMPTATESSESKPFDIWSEDERRSNALKPASAQIARVSSPLSNVAAVSSSSPSSRSNGTIPRSTRQIASKMKKQRKLAADEAGAVQESLKLKERGNELYKRGAYGEAEVAYSNALQVLEVTSLRRIALLNNRANARIKNGDARNALNDTKDVLTLIVMGENGKGSPFLLYRPSTEESLPLPEYADVNLRDGYAKALLRRAQSEEMLEQWETAQSVWSLLEKYEREEGSGKSGVLNLRAAQEGKGRCAKMVDGGDVKLAPKATQRVHASAVQAIAKAERAAKERIKKENELAEAEEAEKDRLRGSVDSRILAWKNGKETNVRALLASLHDVVWAGLGWKKVGMHELVMDNQVKKCYMRAIGKLHPDKLTAKTNTIEERMIGGAVFSVLNDAWSAANAT